MSLHSPGSLDRRPLRENGLFEQTIFRLHMPPLVNDSHNRGLTIVYVVNNPPSMQAEFAYLLIINLGYHLAE